MRIADRIGGDNVRAQSFRLVEESRAEHGVDSQLDAAFELVDWNLEIGLAIRDPFAAERRLPGGTSCFSIASRERDFERPGHAIAIGGAKSLRARRIEHGQPRVQDVGRMDRRFPCYPPA